MVSTMTKNTRDVGSIPTLSKRNISHFHHTHDIMNIFMKRAFQKNYRQTWHCHCELNFWIGAYRILEKSFSYGMLQKAQEPFRLFICNKLFIACEIVHLKCELEAVSACTNSRHKPVQE